MHFSRNLGVQLFPSNTSCGFFHLLQNLSIYLFIQIIIFGSNFYNGAALLPFLKNVKPFFGLFFQVIAWRCFPLSTMVIMIYYILYGRRIICLLDTQCLRHPYADRNGQFFLLAVLGNTILFFTSNLGNIFVLFTQKYRQWTSFEIAFNIFLLYAHSSLSHFHVFATHYLLYSTYQSLVQSNRKLSAGKCTKYQENILLEQFVQLAVINRKLYSLLSIPMSISYFISVVFSMVISFLLTFPIFKWPLAFYPLMNGLYYLYLVAYTQKVRLLAEEIVHNLQANRKGKLGLERAFPRLSKGRLAPNSYAIRCQELELYVDYFRLSIFSLATIDRAFLLGTVLIVLNYAVFIYQT